MDAQNETCLRLREEHLLKKVRLGGLSEGMLAYVIHVELPRVCAAFERLRQGTYGTCDTCEEKIETDRLRAIPEIHTCKMCATQERAILARLR